MVARVNQRIDIMTHSGMVCIDTDAGRYTFNGETAVGIAQALLDAANDVGTKAQVQVDKAPLTQQQRNRVIARVAQMLRSMIGRLDPNIIAAHVVDRVLIDSETPSVLESVEVSPKK